MFSMCKFLDQIWDCQVFDFVFFFRSSTRQSKVFGVGVADSGGPSFASCEFFSDYLSVKVLKEMSP